jgi:O-acetyl-ADP-ribose deacetylase (regulator of RNase III)
VIILRTGDILRANADALVNTVNCVGVMGRGIALQFRKKYPEMFDSYRTASKEGRVQPGSVYTHRISQLVPPYFVINFPTKRHWKGKSQLADIESGLKALVAEVQRLGLKTIAIPPLGCGLGGLDWRVVFPLIESAFDALPEVQAIVFEPTGAPAAEKMVKIHEVPKMTPGRATLLGLMQQYLVAVLDPATSLLEIHKLMYFMQEAGELLRLRYSKGPYGPYAENLKHVLSHIDGHFIDGYGDTDDSPYKEILPRLDAVAQAKVFLSAHPESEARLGRVADLIEGFETPFGMELLATVHWVATKENAVTLEEIKSCTYRWAERKKMFSERHLEIAWRTLLDKNWLTH